MLQIFRIYPGCLNEVDGFWPRSWLFSARKRSVTFRFLLVSLDEVSLADCCLDSSQHWLFSVPWKSLNSASWNLRLLAVLNQWPYAIWSNKMSFSVNYTAMCCSGFSGEKGSRCSDGENICHEGPEEGRVPHITAASSSTSFCDSSQDFDKLFFLLQSVFIWSPLLFLCLFRLRLFATPKTRPIREPSGRSWKRSDTRSLWICSTRSRLGGSSTSYWSIWVVRHLGFFFLFLTLLEINDKPLINSVVLFFFSQEGKCLCS